MHELKGLTHFFATFLVRIKNVCASGCETQCLSQQICYSVLTSSYRWEETQAGESVAWKECHHNAAKKGKMNYRYRARHAMCMQTMCNASLHLIGFAYQFECFCRIYLPYRIVGPLRSACKVTTEKSSDLCATLLSHVSLRRFTNKGQTTAIFVFVISRKEQSFPRSDVFTAAWFFFGDVLGEYHSRSHL